MSRLDRLLIRAYRGVLGLYPGGFGAQERREAVRLFTEMLLEFRAQAGRTGAALFAVRSFAAALGGAGAEWLHARETRQGRWRMGGWRHDVRYAARSVRARPGFALTVVALLGVGIGAVTAVFSVVDAVILRSLPYPDAESLVWVGNPSHSPADFAEWEGTIGSVEAWGGM